MMILLPQPGLAVVTLIGMVISLAISAAASLLAYALTPKPKNNFVFDSRPTILTDRGSYLPLLIGTWRIPGFLCYAGERVVTGGPGGGKGGMLGGGGGGGSPEQYWETGWHLICVGPAARLTKIIQNGSILWEGSISPLDTPSGSVLTMPSTGEGAFIFWGECDQPVNDVLADPSRMGIGSQWPGVCYVLWFKKLLGSSPTWPNIEYEITCKPIDQVLTESQPWMDELTDGDLTDGPNPAHVLWQLLTAKAPYGLGLPAEALDAGAFEALGVLCETEHQPCHVLANDGVIASDLIGQICQDVGVMLPQIGGVIVPQPIRHVDATTLPIVNEDVMVLPAPPVREQMHDETLPDRVIFVIKDRTNAWRDMDIVISDDSLALTRSRNRPVKTSISTVIDRTTAQKVIDRRTSELLTNPEKYTLEVTRGARMLHPGQAFILQGYGQLRVASVDVKLPGRSAKLETVLDQYSGEPGTYVPSTLADRYDAPMSLDPAADLAVLVQEVPAALSADPAIAVARVRANGQISGATVWISGNGSSYSKLGSQDNCAAGGALLQALPATDSMIIENGPMISTLNDDIRQALDLSGNEDDWRTGRQLCLIGDEIFYLRNVTAVVGGWRLDGLIRARYDTLRADHAIGDQVFIVDATTLKTFTSSLLKNGATVYIKTVPTTATAAVDISTVAANELVIGSLRAYRPLPPDNFAGNMVNTFATGGAVTFTWNYRVHDGDGRAADEVLAGEPIGAGTPSRDGPFLIDIMNAAGTTTVRTITVDDDTGNTTYANATMVGDFGTEPASFQARLTNVSGSYRSTSRSILIERI